MGYSTHYTLSVTGPEEFLAEFDTAAANGDTFGEYDEPLESWLGADAFGGDGVKWYRWEPDTKELSQKYPFLLFSIVGEGEEPGDLWKAWFRNGKSVVVQATITFDEPDLDAELPTPDIDAALARIRAIERAELDRQIAELEKRRAAL